MSTEQKLASIRADIAAARQNRAKAEAAATIAADREQQAVVALQSEFGVSTTDEANALIARLEAELDEEVRAVEVLLGKAEQQ